MHSDDGLIFNCKDCQKHNTAVKMVAPSETKCSLKRYSSAPQLKLPRLSYDRDPNQPTPAGEILHEEMTQVCAICSCTIAEDDITCMKCNQTCHSGCMDEDNSDICTACMAAEDQLMAYNIQDSNPNFRDNQKSTPLIRATPTQPGSQRPSLHGATLSPVLKASPSRPKTDSSQSCQKQCTTGAIPKVLGDPTKKAVSKPDNDSAIPKYRELRQQEGKLKKWENELKLREAKIEDKTSETRRQQDIQKLEARNCELEITVKTLRRKINLLETEGSHSEESTKLTTIQKRETDQLILGVREQVTKFVLNKVAGQLDNLEVADTNGYLNETGKSKKIGCYRQDLTTSQHETYNIPVQDKHATNQLIVNPVKNSQPNQPPVIEPQPLQTDVQNFRGGGSQWPHPGPGQNQFILNNTRVGYITSSVNQQVAQCNKSQTQSLIPQYVQQQHDGFPFVIPAHVLTMPEPQRTSASNRHGTTLLSREPVQQQVSQQFQEMAAYAQDLPIFRGNAQQQIVHNAEQQSFLGKRGTIQGWT